MRASNDPKYQHLQEELHVEITAFAPPAEAHARVAYALTEVRKYLIPDSNDEIRQEQMREMEILAANNGDSVSVAAAMAAAAAAVDPIKRAAALSAAAAASMRPAAGAAANGLGQSLQLSQQAVLRAGIPAVAGQARVAAAAAASPYLAQGAPLVRGMAVPQGSAAAGVTTQQQQKLYNEELMLEAAAVSQAPIDISKENR